ncbi:MAG: hypothetical protein ACYDER_23460 [Ktedonobacteraceae bacterium]
MTEKEQKPTEVFDSVMPPEAINKPLNPVMPPEGVNRPLNPVMPPEQKTAN